MIRFAAGGYQLAGIDAGQARRMCAAADFDAIEGCPPLTDGLSAAEVAAAGRAWADAGLPVETYHLPFTWRDDITDLYESRRSGAVARIRAAMETAKSFGATAGILHPGTSRAPLASEGFDGFLRQMGRSLDQLLQAASELDLLLAVENMPPIAGGRFGSLPEHFRRFDQEFGDPHLCFCLDTGHALIAAGHAGTLELMDAMGTRLRAFHLSDSPGDRDLHLAPGRGNVDWSAVFARAASLDALAMCIETPPFARGPEFSDEDWARLVAETRALAAPSAQR